MSKIKLLTQEAAEYIYNYRIKNNLNWTGVQDHLMAEDFIRNWKREYIDAGDEFLRLWLKAQHRKEAKK